MATKYQSPLVAHDPLLKPFDSIIQRRYRQSVLKELELMGDHKNLAESCNNHLYYGLHRHDDTFIFREKAPAAKQIYLYGDFSYWQIEERFALHPLGNGDWEIVLPKGFLQHGMLYKLWVVWQDGADERLPAYARRVVQDDTTKIFSAQVWFPEEPYAWQHTAPALNEKPIIYEAHIGMASEEAKVATYLEFTEEMLPRIKTLGFNTIQLMAIQEHPYYGSFGYQVSNLFAPSSRFGTPEALKQLIDTAHALGLQVILDIVHSHSVCNEKEGLSRFDGSYDLYFHPDERGMHPVWGSRCYNYAKNETLYLLLSNLKYWLEEFHFDGFRFDGITSMCYHDHGIGVNFLTYPQYFDENVDESAWTYLYLANRLVHQLRPQALTIAEEMSGMPGLAFPTEKGGVGFDYRMAMGIPDFWQKMVMSVPDEEWQMGEIFYRLTDKRNEEQVISYVESHDQAMVGDQTLIFRLIGSKMYHQMSLFTPDLDVDRGIALYKLIYFSTFTLATGGYLNFMGNEFGHPEWIDFPREGNQHSFHYARRQWNLIADSTLKYQCLYAFTEAMIHFAQHSHLHCDTPRRIVCDEEHKVLIFERNERLFCFNFHAQQSYSDYLVPLNKTGKYLLGFNGDERRFGGFDRLASDTEYWANGDLSIYLPARTLFVLQKDR